MPTLAKTLKNKGAAIKQREVPLWKGPYDDGPMGGITYSMLSRFIVCRERFRLMVIEGIKPAPHFSQRLEYGNMWHVCEEAFAAQAAPVVPEGQGWQTALKKHAQKLCQEYKMDQPQIQHWYNVCKVQFPIYINYWKKHKDVKQRTPIAQEYIFKVPYKLPSGRTVIVRGKWDSLDMIGPKGKGRLYLQENKTKGDIDEAQLQSHLRFDLQSMMYFSTLHYYVYNYAKAGDSLFQNDPGLPAGVRYNVVRRPLSGGKNSIRQHQPSKKNPAGETEAEFYARLGSLIAEEPEYYFMRWNIDIAASDLKQFEQRCFIPLLEQLCDWWQYMECCKFDPWKDDGAFFGERKSSDGTARYWYMPHSQLPYGVWNPLLEGGSTDLDEYLSSGSMVGLTKVDKLFTELEE